ncbi:MAG TPA: hypothetical protein VII47_06760 [Actinomycetota bacterium]|jgi:hypothetical protein
MSSYLPVPEGAGGPAQEAASTVQFYEALIGKLADVLRWMNEQLQSDTEGSLRLLATKYAVHRGLERWGDPAPDPQIDSAREAAIMLLALGRPRPTATAGQPGR